MSNLSPLYQFMEQDLKLQSTQYIREQFRSLNAKASIVEVKLEGMATPIEVAVVHLHQKWEHPFIIEFSDSPQPLKKFYGMMWESNEQLLYKVVPFAIEAVALYSQEASSGEETLANLGFPIVYTTPEKVFLLVSEEEILSILQHEKHQEILSNFKHIYNHEAALKVPIDGSPKSEWFLGKAVELKSAQILASIITNQKHHLEQDFSLLSSILSRHNEYLAGFGSPLQKTADYGISLHCSAQTEDPQAGCTDLQQIYLDILRQFPPLFSIAKAISTEKAPLYNQFFTQRFIDQVQQLYFLGNIVKHQTKPHSSHLQQYYFLSRLGLTNPQKEKLTQLISALSPQVTQETLCMHSKLTFTNLSTAQCLKTTVPKVIFCIPCGFNLKKDRRTLRMMKSLKEVEVDEERKMMIQRIERDRIEAEIAQIRKDLETVRPSYQGGSELETIDWTLLEDLSLKIGRLFSIGHPSHCIQVFARLNALLYSVGWRPLLTTDDKYFFIKNLLKQLEIKENDGEYFIDSPEDCEQESCYLQWRQYSLLEVLFYLKNKHVDRLQKSSLGNNMRQTNEVLKEALMHRRTLEAIVPKHYCQACMYVTKHFSESAEEDRLIKLGSFFWKLPCLDCLTNHSKAASSRDMQEEFALFQEQLILENMHQDGHMAKSSLKEPVQKSAQKQEPVEKSAKKQEPVEKSAKKQKPKKRGTLITQQAFAEQFHEYSRFNSEVLAAQVHGKEFLDLQAVLSNFGLNYHEDLHRMMDFLIEKEKASKQSNHFYYLQKKQVHKQVYKTYHRKTLEWLTLHSAQAQYERLVELFETMHYKKSVGRVYHHVDYIWFVCLLAEVVMSPQHQATRLPYQFILSFLALISLPIRKDIESKKKKSRLSEKKIAAEIQRFYDNLDYIVEGLLQVTAFCYEIPPEKIVDQFLSCYTEEAGRRHISDNQFLQTETQFLKRTVENLSEDEDDGHFHQQKTYPQSFRAFEVEMISKLSKVANHLEFSDPSTPISCIVSEWKYIVDPTIMSDHPRRSLLDQIQPLGKKVIGMVDLLKLDPEQTEFLADLFEAISKSLAQQFKKLEYIRLFEIPNLQLQHLLLHYIKFVSLSLNYYCSEKTKSLKLAINAKGAQLVDLVFEFLSRKKEHKTSKHEQNTIIAIYFLIQNFLPRFVSAKKQVREETADRELIFTEYSMNEENYYLHLAIILLDVVTVFQLVSSTPRNLKKDLIDLLERTDKDLFVGELERSIWQKLQKLVL